MKKHLGIFLVAAAGVANGIVFLAVSKGHYAAPIVLGLLCLLAAVISVAAYVRRKDGVKHGLSVAAVVLNIPVAFYSMFWLLWLCGLRLIAPPQM